MSLDQLLPYQESLVGFVYDVKKVVAGHHTAQQILIMHPGRHSSGQTVSSKISCRQNLQAPAASIGRDTVGYVKRKDDSGLLDLEPYIRLEDESKYPGENRAN